MPTAARDIQAAIFAALSADTGAGSLDALLARHAADAGDAAIYNGLAPEGAALDYIVVGEPTESGAFGTLGRAGNDGTVQLHVYTADPSNGAALDIYARMALLLDGPRLTLGGNRMVSGALSIVTALTDPATLGRHLVARYAALTLAGAA